MPTYDYQCDACGHKFELFQSIKADPEKRCPECKKLKLRRLIGAGAAIVFKGSGFYQTDYRSKSYQDQAAKETKSTESKPTESKSETKSSSSDKPAASGGAKSEPKTAAAAEK